MKRQPKNRNTTAHKPKESFGRCYAGGWGMDRHGNITVVERHEIRMMSQLSDAQKLDYFNSIVDNSDMPAKVREMYRARAAKLESAMTATTSKRRRAS